MTKTESVSEPDIFVPALIECFSKIKDIVIEASTTVSNNPIEDLTKMRAVFMDLSYVIGYFDLTVSKAAELYSAKDKEELEVPPSIGFKKS
jgi:hypothetical protein